MALKKEETFTDALNPKIYNTEDSLRGPYHARKKIEQYGLLDFLK